MLVNKNNFDEKDYFDENFFLYLENNDFRRRIQKTLIHMLWQKKEQLIEQY